MGRARAAPARASPVALFLFRRDFRLHDNPGLLRALRWCAAAGVPLVPAFAFSGRQTSPRRNAYYSARAFRAMVSLLQDLGAALGPLRPLALFRTEGEDDALLEALHASHPVAAVFFNRDVTPFARARDERIRAWGAGRGVPVDDGGLGDGYTLWPTGSILSEAGTALRVFAPFHRRCLAKRPPRPIDERRVRRALVANALVASGAARRGLLRALRVWGAAAGTTAESELRRAGQPGQPGQAGQPGQGGHGRLGGPGGLGGLGEAGRGRSIVRQIAAGRFDGYDKDRERFALPASTTRLSVHLKFGAVSAAEVLRAARGRAAEGRGGGGASLARQLHWREYYYHLAAAHPELLGGLREGRALGEPNAHVRPDRQALRWRGGDRARLELARWTGARTGEPLVDAAMRCLRATGWLHNRLRMVAASHLVHEMGVDWRLGERAMAALLLDYDPCQNSGGWQSMDAQRPGRTIKASSQAARYDPDGAFTRAWQGLSPATPPPSS